MNIVVDFESYYSKKDGISVVDQGIPNYVATSNAYLMSVAGPGFAWVGKPTDVPDDILVKLLHKDSTLWAAHSNFDQAWFHSLFATKKLFNCILDRAAVLQWPRNLAGVVKLANGVALDKGARDMMNGVRFETLSEDDRKRVTDYALADATEALKALESMGRVGGMSGFEADIAAHTRKCNREGVRIDTELLERDKQLLGKIRFEAFHKIPWTKEGGKPLSHPNLNQWCQSNGITPPPSLAVTDEFSESVIEGDPRLSAVVGYMRDYRKANTFLEKIHTLEGFITPSGDAPIDLIYCGARHTRRWSSQGFNIQNLPRDILFTDHCVGLPEFEKWKAHVDDDLTISPKAAYKVDEGGSEWPGIFMRHYIVPRPGKKFLILDLAQIEPRCLNWLVGNDEMLDAVRGGFAIYEAYARTSMGWTGGSLKKENPKMYQLAKASVLGAGYGAGGTTFQRVAKTMAGLSLAFPEAEKAIADFRGSNKKIIDFWASLDKTIKTAANSDQTVELEMPTGDYLRHFHVKGAIKQRHSKTGKPYSTTVYSSTTTRGDFSAGSVQNSLWGGVLTENVTQRMARDVLAGMILDLEDAGIKVVFSAHDEVVCEVDADNAEDAMKEAQEIMSREPAWAPGLPLAAEGDIVNRYTKL